MTLDRWSIVTLVVAVVLAIIVRNLVLRLGAGASRSSRPSGKTSNGKGNS